MRLDPYVRNYRSYRDELVTVLDRADTRFYLDTSLLTWLIRLGGKARSEFISWARSRPEGSVRIPVWAAHELHTHTVRKSLVKNVKSLVSETEKKYSEFARAAAERADDLSCSAAGFSGREGYLEQVQLTLATLSRFGKIISDEASLSRAADEVTEFVNTHLLATDLMQIIKDIEVTGDLRYSHNVPPGFQDRNKDIGRYGDLIIWREMMGDMPPVLPGGTERPAAVLISRDAKNDWVSTAPLVEDETERTSVPKPDSGFDVVLPHPTLVHEFSTETGGCSIYVTHPGMLASALQASTMNPSQGVRTWLSAAFKPDFLNQVESLFRRFPPTSPPEHSEGSSAEMPLLHRQEGLPAGSQADQPFAPPSLQDLLAPSVRRIVSDVAVGGLDEQAAATAAWLEATAEGSLSPIELGARLASFYAGPDRNADLAAVLEMSRGRLTLEARRVVVLAVAVHACFAANGDVRRPPLTSLLNVMITVAADPTLAPAFSALAAMTRQAAAEYLYLPGQAEAPTFQIDLAEKSGNLPQRIRAILIGGENVLVDVEPESQRSLNSLLGAQQCQGRQLRLMLAREYAIDPAALKTTWDQQSMKWDSEAGLALLDPEAPGGVSPMDDGDDE